MSGNPELSADGRTMAVRVPMTVAKRGGRKVVLAPEEAAPRSRGKVDSTLVRALARAFRWRNLIETGVHGTIAELATAEKVNPSYVSRLFRLTLLAPDIVEEILDGRQPAGFKLERLMRSLPVEWERQDGRRPISPLSEPGGRRARRD